MKMNPIKKYSKFHQGILAILSAVLVINSCCIVGILLTLAFIPGWRLHSSEQSIGFSFKNRVPQVRSGDVAAGSHLFIHQYAIPEDGEITAIAYLDDSEASPLEIQEEVIILLLRPEPGGLRIVERVEILSDELTPSKSGVILYPLEKPLQVKKGDLFGHWQKLDLPTGPFPLNVEMGSMDGFSIGQAGFSEEDIVVGNLISTQGFTGRRDYFINLIFRPKE
jgi:hypothetical protein